MLRKLVKRTFHRRRKVTCNVSVGHCFLFFFFIFVQRGECIARGPRVIDIIVDRNGERNERRTNYSTIPNYFSIYRSIRFRERELPGSSNRIVNFYFYFKIINILLFSDFLLLLSFQKALIEFVIHPRITREQIFENRSVKTRNAYSRFRCDSRSVIFLFQS